LFEIIKYEPRYEDELMKLIKLEGEDWKIYWEEPNASRYRKSFEQSITFLALSNGKVCGYSRSLKDALFIYVCDLLVNKKYRGYGLGEMLMRCLQKEYPEYPIYIMSGNDEYYSKIDCIKEGSIYLLKS
jgi:ribosomal protein S18 acetylase RimI-like enzyme